MAIKKETYRNVILSLGLGLLMTVGLYLFSNVSFSFSSENQALKWYFQLTSYFRDTNRPVPEDMLLINVSYDRKLVDRYDEDGYKLGNIDITDRGKLARLLQLLNRRGDYRYIIMDVRFEDSLTSEDDSLLWAEIARTERIVFPMHVNTMHTNNISDSKYAMADYSSSIEEGDFTKYVMAPPQRESIAYRVYHELTGNEYSSYPGFKFSEGHLMRNAMMINLDINPNTEYDSKGHKKSYNLGTDILEDPDESIGLAKDRIIFVGDFAESDKHPTYKGYMAGPALHANAINDLFNHKHLIGWWTLLALWLTLSGLVLATIYQSAIVGRLHASRWLPTPIAQSRYLDLFKTLCYVLMSFVGYGTILTVIFIIFYLATGQIYEIISLSVIYIILSVIFKKK